MILFPKKPLKRSANPKAEKTFKAEEKHSIKKHGESVCFRRVFVFYFDSYTFKITGRIIGLRLVLE